MTVIIDGKEFELRPLLNSRDGLIISDNPGVTVQGYALKPVAKEKQDKRIWTLSFSASESLDAYLISNHALTVTQAEALKHAIESLLEYVFGNSDIDLQQLSNAREAIQKDSES